MSIFRNVVLNLKTEEECDRVIGLYKEQLSSLENEGLVDVYICRLSKDSVLFFLTINNDDNAQRIFETMRAFREQQNLDLIDIYKLSKFDCTRGYILFFINRFIFFTDSRYTLAAKKFFRNNCEIYDLAEVYFVDYLILQIKKLSGVLDSILISV